MTDDSSEFSDQVGENWKHTCDVLIQINENGAYRCGEPAVGFVLFKGKPLWYCEREAVLIKNITR